MIFNASNFLKTSINYYIVSPFQDKVSFLFQEIMGPLLQQIFFREASYWEKSFIGRFFYPALNQLMQMQKVPIRCEAIDEKRRSEATDLLKRVGDFRDSSLNIRFFYGSSEKWKAFKDKESFLQACKVLSSDLQKIDPIEGAEKVAILRSVSFGFPIEMEKFYIGLYLALGFNVFLFERGAEATSQGVYNAAESVYQEVLKEGFTENKILVTGNCRSSFVASYLKKQHQDVMAVLALAPLSLKSVVDHQPWPLNQIVSCGLFHVESTDFPLDHIQLLQNVSKEKIAILAAKEDQTVFNTETQALVNGLESKVEVLWKEKNASETIDPHFKEPLKDPKFLQSFRALLERWIEK